MATRKVLEVSAAGIEAASLQDNVNSLNERQRDAFGADLALSPQTPQAQWSGIAGLGLTEVGEAGVRAALYGSSVDHAAGTALDAHGSLLDIPRRVATRSRVTVTMYGVAGVFVPLGSRVKTDAGVEFRTIADTVLSPAGVQQDMEAVETGPQEAAAGALTSIVSVIAGWERVTNAEAAALGQNRQSDEEYRRAYFVRTAHSSNGALSSLEAAIEEALAGKQRVVENPENTDRVIQEWTVGSHSILVISEKGSDGDVRRAVENHRGMGVGTMSAIRGAGPTDATLASMNNGSIVWNGSTYTGLNITGDSTGADRAASLTSLLASDTVPPTIAFIDGRYVAIFRWRPDRTPNFAVASSNDGVAAFGFDPDDATYPAGPFLRPTSLDLTVSFTLTVRSGFPADGLTQVRQNVLERVVEYGIGQEVWAPDLSCEAERVPGTRITNFVVTANGQEVSGVAVPLTRLWRLQTNNLTITVVQ